MKEPVIFIQIGSQFVNGACDLRTFADNLDSLVVAGDEELGNSKGFKKARKLSKKARKWANKIEKAHKQAQAEAEELGYEIQTGDDFKSACDGAGISLRGPRG